MCLPDPRLEQNSKRPKKLTFIAYSSRYRIIRPTGDSVISDTKEVVTEVEVSVVIADPKANAAPTGLAAMIAKRKLEAQAKKENAGT